MSTYQIGELIGKGGMGTVYRARQHSLDRDVAIKFVMAPTPEALKRFRREYESLSAMQHPNVVRLFDAGRHKDQVYFVMEYLDAVDLDRTLRRAPIPPDAVVSILDQVLDALAFVVSVEGVRVATVTRGYPHGPSSSSIRAFRSTIRPWISCGAPRCSRASSHRAMR